MTTDKRYAEYKKARYLNDELAARGVPTQGPRNAIRRLRATYPDAEDWTGWTPDDIRDSSVSYSAYGTAEVIFTESLPPWLVAEAISEGWNPAHLNVRVFVGADEWLEYPLDTIKNQDFDVRKAKSFREGTWRDWRGVEHPEELDRPERHSVLVDYSSYRERSDYYWVTYDDEDLYRDFSLKGMAKGPRAVLEHELRVEQAASAVKYLEDCAREDICPYNLVVEVWWRGEAVGEDSLGCTELRWEDFQGGPLLDLVREHNMVEEAWAGAQQWAESAVDDAKAAAAQIVEDMSLLPSASHRAVQRVMDAKLIDIQSKESA